MNILIVDDETPAREELLWLLEQSGEPVCVLGQAEDAKGARALLAQHQDSDEPIELIFLDVDMPAPRSAPDDRLRDGLSRLRARRF